MTKFLFIGLTAASVFSTGCYAHVAPHRPYYHIVDDHGSTIVIDRRNHRRHQRRHRNYKSPSKYHNKKYRHDKKCRHNKKHQRSERSRHNKRTRAPRGSRRGGQ